MNQNNLERIFRNGSDGKRKFSTAEKTGERFSLYCKKLLETDMNFDNAALHTGFGIPKSGEIPLRLPVILVPALEIMKGLLHAGVTPPKFVIYQASGVISHINEIDTGEATALSISMEQILREFIQVNFPELLPYVVFSFGAKLHDPEIIEHITQYSESIEDTLSQQSKEHFIRSEQKHSNGNGKSLMYVAANSYYNGGFDEYAFSQEIGDPEIIMPIGGRSETQFFKTLLETQTSCREIFPLITPVGAYPSYYQNKKGDLMTPGDMSDCLSGNNHFTPDIQKDAKVLSSFTL